MIEDSSPITKSMESTTMVGDVAVKSVDGSQSSRELEDLQETREVNGVGTGLGPA
jgi:hypothetical protein